MKKIHVSLFFFIFTSQLFAQKITIEAYIEMYKDIAMKEMVRTGVPASITLAQGILETENGNSALVKKSNNHFGIKCKETWTGPSVSHDDDAPQECFRKYENAIASYIDHSDFLRTRKHYHFLFDLDPLDYKAWAYGLKKAGYATNPKYPQILIKYIETYHLHDYSLMAMGKMPHVNPDMALKQEKIEAPGVVAEAQPQPQSQPKQEEMIVAINPVKQMPLLESANEEKKPEENKIQSEVIHNTTSASTTATNNIPEQKTINAKSNEVISTDRSITEIKKQEVINQVSHETPSAIIQQQRTYPSGEFKINDTRVVYADKGTSLNSLAASYNLPVRYIYDFNDYSEDIEVLTQSQLIYLQRKRRVGAVAYHIVESGESLYDIAQKQGIRLEALIALNRLSKEQKPVVGQKLYLQTEAPSSSVSEVAMIDVAAHVGEGVSKADDEAYEVHVVQPKQTLFALSKQYNVSIDELMQWNNLSGPDIKEGMELIVSQKDYNVYKSSR